MCALLKNSKDFFNNFKMVKDILKIRKIWIYHDEYIQHCNFFLNLLSNKRALLKKSRKQNLWNGYSETGRLETFTRIR